ncbi:alpha/beta hydrolase-fold protein [Acinetobacter sp. YH12239]|uniref:alpha/beta hydrolase-fold protein n=1 Tax=Acinetobacter sp. YH12239 TaxID=2601166 RepID=UPI00211E68D2|nr:alpha/beta hydrolase-fold protein [Acinetobacter sp. YH12239]
MNHPIKFFSILMLVSSAVSADLSVNHSLQVSTQSYAPVCEDMDAKSKVLQQIQKQIQMYPDQKNHLLDQFWSEIRKNQTPIIEDFNETHQRVIYLYRGAKHNVRLIGGPSNDHEWLTRLKGTDIWFKESIVDSRFIGSYSFAVDSPNMDGYLSNYCPHLNPNLKESRDQRRSILKVQQLDPLNPHKWFDSKNIAIKTNTTLRNENIAKLSRAPNFIDPTQMAENSEKQLVSSVLKSKVLGNDRLIQIYATPPQVGKSYITLIFFDGEQYAHLVKVPQILDQLVQQQQLPPIQAVFVGHPNDQLRAKELSPNPEYTQFFQEELLPWMSQHLPYQRDHNKTVLLGSSLGGLSSAYLALKISNDISHVVPLSGSFWWKSDPNDTINGMSKLIRASTLDNTKKLNWYISANSYEYSRQNNSLSILETSPIVAQDLIDQGHNVHYQEYIGGHSYAVWKIVIQDALKYFFKNKSH